MRSARFFTPYRSPKTRRFCWTVRFPGNGREVGALKCLRAVRIDIHAFDTDAPGIRRENAQNHINGGGLPCSVWTQKPDYFIAPDVERNAIYGDYLPVGLAQLRDR